MSELGKPGREPWRLVAVSVFAMCVLIGAPLVGYLVLGPAESKIGQYEEHVRRKRQYLYMKRTGQIHPKMPYNAWLKHVYPQMAAA